ncbi:MAG: hypothetical protein JSS31_18005 [Proteobacteria bacterium]|nr:hypothetical protein [Pseudomonadota bacterium]
MNEYLPKLASVEQACDWLQQRTGEAWNLPRLLEYGLVPHFWLDRTEEHSALFGERHEGLLLRVMFQGDITRLETAPDVGLVSIAGLPDGRMVRFNPPCPVALSELRFTRDEVQNAMPQAAGPAPTVNRGTPKALTDAQEAEIVKLYARGRGQSVNALAKKFSVSNPTIDKALKKAGVKK